MSYSCKFSPQLVLRAWALTGLIALSTPIQARNDDDELDITMDVLDDDSDEHGGAEMVLREEHESGGSERDEADADSDADDDADEADDEADDDGEDGEDDPEDGMDADDEEDEDVEDGDVNDDADDDL